MKITKKTVWFEGHEFQTAGEAIQYANADPRFDVAIAISGKHLAVSEATADVLEQAGYEMAYLCDMEMPNGEHRVVTVPVN